MDSQGPQAVKRFVGLCATVALATVLGAIAWRKYSAHSAADRPLSSLTPMVQPATPAPAATTISADDQENAAIAASLDSFSTALAASDVITAQSDFDTTRLYAELKGAGATKIVSEDQQGNLERILSRGVGKTLMEQSREISWTGHRIKKIVFSTDRSEATVYDIASHGAGEGQRIQRMRWWMCKSYGRRPEAANATHCGSPDLPGQG
jgi:hypothetical protein